MKLIVVSEVVKGVLIKYPETRNSDYYLYLKVLERTAELNGSPNPKNLTLEYFLCHAKELNFPYFETVRRTRQKIQESIPELKAVPAVEKVRAEKEKAFRQYARSELQ